MFTDRSFFFIKLNFGAFGEKAGQKPIIEFFC